MGVFALPTLGNHIMRIDFYILEQQTIKQRDHFVCQLAQKAYLRDHQLYIHTEHRQQAQDIDRLLWTFQDASFVPHQVTIEDNPRYAEFLPVLIGYKDKPTAMQDILINLSASIPPFFDQFNRLIEIVPADEQWKTIMRSHYRYYADKDYQLITHTIKGTR